MDSKRKHDIVGYGKIGHCKHFRRWECIARQDMVRQGVRCYSTIWRYGKMRYNTAGCGKKGGAKLIGFALLNLSWFNPFVLHHGKAHWQWL